jgi:hypothetical protein
MPPRLNNKQLTKRNNISNRSGRSGRNNGLAPPPQRLPPPPQRLPPPPELAKFLYSENEKRYATTPRKTSEEDWIFNKIVSEILLQFFLICSNYRKMAEIKLKTAEIKPALRERIESYLIESHITYQLNPDIQNPKFFYLYLFKNEEEQRAISSSINNARGTKTADGLGEFYTCKAERDEWKSFQWRIVIVCDNIELYAQMCNTQEDIARHIMTSMKVYDEIRDLFMGLDRTRFTKTPNPLKMHIYRATVQE